MKIASSLPCVVFLAVAAAAAAAPSSDSASGPASPDADASLFPSRRRRRALRGGVADAAVEEASVHRNDATAAIGENARRRLFVDEGEEGEEAIFKRDPTRVERKSAGKSREAVQKLVDDHASGKKNLDEKSLGRYNKLLKRFDAIENFGVAKGDRLNGQPRYHRKPKGEKRPEGMSLVEDFRKRRGGGPQGPHAEGVATAGSGKEGGGASVSEGGKFSESKAMKNENRPFRTGRLDRSEMKIRAEKMGAELAAHTKGEATLNDKTVRRYRSFIKRYEQLQKEFLLMGETHDESGGENKDGGSGGDKGKVEGQNKALVKTMSKGEFPAPKGQVAGNKAKVEARVAGLRKDIADHESGSKQLKEQTYERKKKALARYERGPAPRVPLKGRGAGVTKEKKSDAGAMKEKKSDAVAMKEKKGDAAVVVSKEGEAEEDLFLCPMDVHKCPDGTFVSRDTGAKCEFKSCADKKY